jgi:formylglycine-generating enzyme
MKMAFIPAGEFIMGSPADEKGREDDERQHTVKITKAFRIGVTEVTQAQWTKVMGQRKGKFAGDDRPVEEVSWKDAVAFCRKLSQLEGQTYRLPTEAEWEYAGRAGATGRFSGGARLVELGWCDDNGGDETHAVAGKRPNAWGLYDLHGNVAEWCADYYAPAYGTAQASDPAGPAEGKARVVRGGSFASFERGCRCASRGSTPESYQLKTLGFRIVQEAGR